MGSPPEGLGTHPWPAQDPLSRPQISTVGAGKMCGEESELKSMARSGLGWVVHGRQAMREGPHRSQGELQ